LSTVANRDAPDRDLVVKAIERNFSNNSRSTFKGELYEWHVACCALSPKEVVTNKC
jgi:hypothetical protein